MTPLDYFDQKIDGMKFFLHMAWFYWTTSKVFGKKIIPILYVAN
jgi:hypothetical protein